MSSSSFGFSFKHVGIGIRECCVYRTTRTSSFGDITHTATSGSSSLPRRSPPLSAASAPVAERERVGFERPAGAEVAARLARWARIRRRLALVAAAQRIPRRSSGRHRRACYGRAAWKPPPWATSGGNAPVGECASSIQLASTRSTSSAKVISFSWGRTPTLSSRLTRETR